LRQFSTDEFTQLLQAADRRLGEPGKIVIIGGTAIGLLANRSRSTTDLDVLPGLSDVVRAALEGAKVATGLKIPIQPVGIYHAPDGFEERLKAAPIHGLQHLSVLLPEVHDLAIMKLPRGNEHDLQAIEVIHEQHALCPDVLFERYKETWVTGPRSGFRAIYLVMIERLFGDAVANAHEGALEEGA